MTPEDGNPVENEARPEREATRSEREANPTPPAEEAVTAEDVHDTPQLPPENHRGSTSDDE